MAPLVCQPVLSKNVAMKERSEWALEKVSPSQLFIRHQCKETEARFFPRKMARCPGCGKRIPAGWLVLAVFKLLRPSLG